MKTQCNSKNELWQGREHLPGNPVVVSLPHSADCCDVGSHQVVLGQV